MSKVRFVYLTSAPFSGSTLFSFLVNMHPQIATVGEMSGLIKSSDPDTYQCSCGEKIRTCYFWRQVTKQMESRSFTFDPGVFDTAIRLGNNLVTRRIFNSTMRSALLEDIRDQLLPPQARVRLSYLIARNRALAESILQVTGKTVFFDASKSPSAIRHFYRDPDIDFRVIHLVRDVRGASLSRRKNRGEHDWPNTVRHWVRVNRNIERQLRRLPAKSTIRLRYEDLCITPTETLAKFYEFCGLEPKFTMGEFFQSEHHIVGNRMRLANVGQLYLDEGWRRMLTVEEQECTNRLAATMHARYGYPKMCETDLDQSRTRDRTMGDPS